MDAIHFSRILINIREDYRRPVIPLLFFFAAGLICGREIYLPRQLSGSAVGFCLVLILVSILCRRPAVILPLVLFFFSGWLAMTGYSFPAFPAGHVIHFAGDTQWTITGTIIDETASGPGRRIFFVTVRRLEHGPRHIRAGGNLRVTVYGAQRPDLACGRLIRFSGRIIKIANFKNPGRFDYERFMAFRKVFGLTYTEAAGIEVLSADAISGWRQVVENVRQKIAVRIEESGRGVQTAILKALIIGRRDDLTPRIREVFSKTGASHLLAISGLHVGIVCGLVFFALVRIFAFIPFLTWRGWVKKWAAVCALPGVIGYGLLSGMSPATQRAVIMVVVFLAALMAGRRHQLMNTLALAALVILAVHPPSLFAVSFQLSFAAVFFIILGMSAASDLLDRFQNRWIKGGAGFMLVSAFAIAGTSPLTACYFNQVSWVGLLTNCLMIPLIGFTVVPLGLTGAAVSFIRPGPAMLIFKTCGGILSLSYAVLEKIAGLPGVASITVTPGLIEIACYYLMLWAAIILIRHRHAFFPSNDENPSPAMPREARIALATAVIVLIVMVFDAGYWINRRFLHDDLRITILDVGQGNSAVLELPGGKCMLIDGGGFTGSSTFDVGQRIVAPFLWRNKIRTVDTIVLTHPDTDHLGGLIYIADNFHVKTVWSTGESVDMENYRRFLEVVERNRIHMPDFARLGKSRVINGVRFEILYPPPDFMDRKKVQPWRTPNNNSLVIRVSLGDISFLFPGDIMAAGEREAAVRAGRSLASTVLTAPHHGSRTSSTDFFLSRVRPKVVVVSTGRFNRFGCPCPDVLKRYAAVGAEIFRTDTDGAVVMSTRGETLRVKTPLADE